jgi:hypothetical protein
VTIVTCDISFLLDTDEEAHLRGLDDFMATIEQYFSKDQLQTIRIAVVMGKAVPIDASSFRMTPCSNGKEVDKDESYQVRTSQLSSLIKNIQRRIEEKLEETFKRNRSQIQFDSKLVPRMDIRLLLVKGRNGFHQLLQVVSMDNITAFPYDWSQTLHLALPETVDFDSCKVTMQASYKIMPFRLDSALTMSLSHDLELISRSELQALQLIPTESIDASLLYGIPISLRSGLAKSTDQYRENVLMLRAMLKTLAKRDCALLLSSTFLAIDQTETAKSNLFQERENQYYILMPEILGSQVGPPTYNGVLFRIARADHILDPDTVDGAQKGIHSLGMTNGETSEYDEYVEMSLESLSCSPLNPLFIRQSEASAPMHTFSSLERKRVTWKEDRTRTSDATYEVLKGNVYSKTVSTPRSKDLTVDKIWKDDSGIGLFMCEKKELEKESPDRKELIEKQVNDESVSIFDSCGGSDANISVRELQRHPAQAIKYDQGCGNEHRYDILAENCARKDSDIDETKEPNGHIPDGHESSDGIEDSDDETALLDTTGKSKRKPTEVAPPDSLLHVSSKDFGETEWTQEDTGESSPSSSSSLTSEKSADGKSPIGKFEYT